jgi:hypothetical protein
VVRATVGSRGRRSVGRVDFTLLELLLAGSAVYCLADQVWQCKGGLASKSPRTYDWGFSAGDTVATMLDCYTGHLVLLFLLNSVRFTKAQRSASKVAFCRPSATVSITEHAINLPAEEMQVMQ